MEHRSVGAPSRHFASAAASGSLPRAQANARCNPRYVPRQLDRLRIWTKRDIRCSDDVRQPRNGSRCWFRAQRTHSKALPNGSVAHPGAGWGAALGGQILRCRPRLRSCADCFPPGATDKLAHRVTPHGEQPWTDRRGRMTGSRMTGEGISGCGVSVPAEKAARSQRQMARCAHRNRWVMSSGLAPTRA